MSLLASVSSLSMWQGWLIAVVAVLVYHFGLRRFFTKKQTHDEKVARIRKQILDWNALPKSERRPLCTARTRALTIRAIGLYKANAQKISFADMDQVVFMDTERRIARVEPMADMDQVSSYLVPKGWSLPIVPELKMLTVGGLVMGLGIESSSHKYGLFHNTVRACTIILADGRILTVSREHEPELFSSVFFSCGSWCFLLSVDIDIMPIKPFVRVDYKPYNSSTAVINALTDATAPAAEATAPDFMEGLLFSPTIGVLCTANYVTEQTVMADAAKWHNVRWYSKLYYAIVRDTFGLPQASGYQYLRTTDYYFRHDRGLFWALELVGNAVHYFVWRLFFGWVLNYNAAIRDLFPSPVWSKQETETAWEKVRMVSDAVFPLNADAPKVFDELQVLFDIYPIWLCPTKVFHHTEDGASQYLFHFPEPERNAAGQITRRTQFLDVGLYGVPRSKLYAADHVHCQRGMEEIVRRAKGFMFTYSVGYSTYDEFWRTFDKTRYDNIRARTGATGSFVDLYTKLGGGDKITRYLNNIALKKELAEQRASSSASASAAAADEKH